jgi:rhodanese-related sulfurtransferase
LKDVNEVFGDTPGVTIITMCKTDGRGAVAAGVLETNGYNVFNMQFAFEGPADAGGYRTING